MPAKRILRGRCRSQVARTERDIEREFRSSQRYSGEEREKRRPKGSKRKVFKCCN